MDEIDIMLLETGGRDANMQRTLAQGLRRKREIGELGMLTGDEVLAPFGQQLNRTASRDLINETQRLDKKSQRDMTQGYYDSMAESQGLKQAMSKRKQDEIERHNRAMEQASMAKSTGGRSPPMGVQKQAAEAIGEFSAMRELSASFQDDYANNSWIPFEGEMSNVMGRSVFGTDDQKKQGEWWARYRRQYELGARNRLFGSALTEPEIRAWNAANIAPNSPPDVIKKALDNMQMVSQRVLLRQAKGHAAVYDPEWIEAVYGEAQFDDLGGGSQGEAPSVDASSWFEESN